MITRDEIEQAVEIAVGDNLSHEGFKPRAASEAAVAKWLRRFRRTLAELPPDLTIQDLLEALPD